MEQRHDSTILEEYQSIIAKVQPYTVIQCVSCSFLVRTVGDATKCPRCATLVLNTSRARTDSKDSTRSGDLNSAS
jgi:phage FluMu protein Com